MRRAEALRLRERRGERVRREGEDGRWIHLRLARLLRASVGPHPELPRPPLLSPVYYAHPSGRIQSFLDRLFFSTMRADGYAALHHKPVAGIVVARRAGTSASFDVLNKYATISQMIVVGSSYWNEFHALTKDDVPGDPEGLQTLRNLARNMVYVMKCQKAGRDAGILPPANESGVFTNFVR